MVKSRSVFVCQSCSSQFPKWSGQCGQCGQWNSLVETTITTAKTFGLKQNFSVNSDLTVNLSKVKSKTFSRFSSGIGELDRVLGGGIVPGSVILVAGSPGMGKSTLLTQLALKVTAGKRQLFTKVVYVCGEESPSQVKLRVNRLLAKKQLPQNFWLLPETNTETVVEQLSNNQFKNQSSKKNHQNKSQFFNFLVIIDSIQTLWTQRLTGVAGSVGQIRESANQLLQFAKANQAPIFLVGHVTKEGAIAGPKVLEHLVDVVLYLEGDGKHEFRLLRTVKNRFGSTDEVGVFLMRDSGMEEITNPSEIFLSDHQDNVTGSTVVVSMQGARPILVEIQALVTPTSLAIPRRIGTGLDQRRLQILTAILQKHAGLKLFDKDVYVNIAGGLTIREPAIDLGICLSIASSYKNQPVLKKTAVIGEVGLLGELRRVAFVDKRIKEAKTQDYQVFIADKKLNHIKSAIYHLLEKR